MEIQKLVDEALSFKFCSVRYADFDKVRDIVLLSRGEEGIFFTGFNETDGKNTLYWGTDCMDRLKDRIGEIDSGCLVAFIPPEWREELSRSGLREYAEYQEFWAIELQGSGSEVTFVKKSDYPRSHEITMKCQGQSRGFLGEPLDWIESWAEDSADEEFTEETRLIGEYQGDHLAGIACVGIYGDPKTLWVREIAVDPNEQGKGVGRKLILKAFAWGRKKNAIRAFLMVDVLNRNAVHLYQKMGFEPGKDSQIDMIKA